MKKLKPFDQRPYRPGVGIVLFNRQGLVFVGQRVDARDLAWQMPQGGIDEGETPEQAAWREMKEEIGTDHAELLGETPGWITYDLPPDIADKVWHGKFRGQKHKWFAFRFLGEDGEIDLASGHPEFAEWRWMDLAQVTALIIPFKRALYDEVTAHFLPLAQQLAKARSAEEGGL